MTVPTRDVEPSDPARATAWAAVRQTWTSPRRLVGILVAAVPTLVFVTVTATSALRPGLLAAGAAAVLGFVVQLISHRPVRSAIIGLLLVGVCGGVAAFTGEARGFFLVPAMIPFAVICGCLATIVARRPLTGLILNRIAGGPRQWWHHRPLLRVHLVATTVAIAVNVVNAAVQVIFYRAGDTVVLAVAHIATGPVFATLVAVTVVYARRNLPR